MSSIVDFPTTNIRVLFRVSRPTYQCMNNFLDCVVAKEFIDHFNPESVNKTKIVHLKNYLIHTSIAATNNTED